MSMVRCYDVTGNAVTIASEAITFRPAVYGIFIENQQIILLKHPITDLWFPPGRILESHEIPTQVVRHYFRRYTDMMPALGSLLFVEDQYRVDENGRAWHLSALYYALSRAGATVTAGSGPVETVPYEWIPLSALKRDRMMFGYEAIQAGQLRLKI
jgi:ADP-ribose pyrophosphatase YjhB (NUDIX family)